jgi:hypothetical protein
VGVPVSHVPDKHVCARMCKGVPGQHAEEVHDQVIENAAMLLPQLVQAVEHNQLDIVVRLFQHQANVARGRSWWAHACTVAAPRQPKEGAHHHARTTHP